MIPQAFAASNGILKSIGDFLPGGIQNLLNLGLGLGAILAFGTIIYAGIIYTASGDNASKQKDARAWIWAAVQGLGLLALGFILFNTINPRLLSMEEIKVGHLEPPAVEENFQFTGPVVTPGDTTSYSNVPLLKQAGDGWGNDEYGTGCKKYDSSTGKYEGTYATSGCAPTSIAMAVLFLTGNKYMSAQNAVKTIGNDAVAGGYRVCGDGTYSSAVTGIPPKYGLSVSGISGQSDLASCIESGGVAIGNMRGVTDSEANALKNADFGHKPIFTLYGHYIVVTGIDETKGMVFINDPGGRDVASSDIGHYFTYARYTWCIKK